MEINYPTDENLRLIFAQGHETWLRDQLNETKRLAIRLAVITAIGIAWLIGVAWYVSEATEADPGCIRLEQGASLSQLIEQGTISPGTTECADNPVASAQAPDKGGVANATKLGLGVATLVALTIILAAGVETIRRHLQNQEIPVPTSSITPRFWTNTTGLSLPAANLARMSTVRSVLHIGSYPCSITS